MGLPLLRDNCGPTLLMRFSHTQCAAKFAAPLMGLLPLKDCELTLLMGLSLTRSSEFTTLLMGLPPLGDNCEPTPLLGSLPLGFQRLQVPLMGSLPLGNYNANSPRHSVLNQSTITETDQHSEEA